MARKKKQKQDEAHDETDRIIEQTEKKIHTEYAKAEKELKKKVEAFFKKFEAEDEEKRQQLANGEITADYYKKWRTTRMATGQRWEDMRQIIAEDMTNANNLARSTINGHAADVYALNRNFATYQVEKEARINTSFTLYNRRAVERLMVNDERLLPLPTEGSRAWQAMMNKDLRWNQQKINSSLIQGILQGDSIPEISDRLLNIVGMNEVSARRSARTMMTSVENKARDDSYEELKSKGVELETIWLATLDDRTRHSHRQLHGEVRGEDGKYSNGLRYPADPAGAPEEVYNCRCCEISHVKGHPIDIPKWSPKMGDMTFEEWLGEHEEKAVQATNTFGHTYGETFKVNGYDVKLNQEKNFEFEGGREGFVFQTRDADIYTISGKMIVFPSDLDTSKQTMTPEQIITELTNLDDNYRSKMQDKIVVVDYRNPQDSHWEEVYKMKGFRSYATGGKQITFYEATYHDMPYVKHTLLHEGGHYIDRVNSVGGLDSYKYFSDGSEWVNAMIDDRPFRSKAGFKGKASTYVSNYAMSSSSTHEYFADACAEYYKDKKKFKKMQPNRFALLKRIIDG